MICSTQDDYWCWEFIVFKTESIEFKTWIVIQFVYALIMLYASQHGLTLIPRWIRHYYNVWEEIAYPFPNFNGAAGMDKKFHPRCWVCDYLFMLGLKLSCINKRIPRSRCNKKRIFLSWVVIIIKAWRQWFRCIFIIGNMVNIPLR